MFVSLGAYYVSFLAHSRQVGAKALQWWHQGLSISVSTRQHTPPQRYSLRVVLYEPISRDAARFTRSQVFNVDSRVVSRLLWLRQLRTDQIPSLILSLKLASDN